MAPPNFSMDVVRLRDSEQNNKWLFSADLKARKLDLSGSQHRLPCGQPLSGYPRELLPSL